METPPDPDPTSTETDHMRRMLEFGLRHKEKEDYEPAQDEIDAEHWSLLDDGRSDGEGESYSERNR